MPVCWAIVFAIIVVLLWGSEPDGAISTFSPRCGPLIRFSAFWVSERPHRMPVEDFFGAVVVLSPCRRWEIAAGRGGALLRRLFDSA